MIQPSRDQIEQAIAACAASYGVPVRLAMMQCQAESSFNQAAVSPCGAIGLFQLMPATAAELKVDPKDWRANIEGGLRYLSQQKKAFGSWEKALAAYNWGGGNLRKCITKYGDEWVNHLPAETENYLRKILG